jgi:hypothetical protein
MAVATFAFVNAVYYLLEVLVVGIKAPGFPSLIISVMFFAGVQLISLGVLGEYIGRVFAEVKGRPLYLVAEEVGGQKSGDVPRPAEAERPVEFVGTISKS